MSRVLAEILELPVADRVRLVQEIWDSVSLAPDSLPISDGERDLLDRRLDAYRRDPAGVSPWPDVKRRILGET